MTLNRFDRWGIIIYTVKKAESGGIRVGHTLLQKLIYLLQEGHNVPMEYEFKLHHFGPYSKFLWSEITSLRDYGFLKIETDPDGYGYNVSFGEENEWTRSREETIPKDKIDNLLNILEGRFTRDLELLATTHYIYNKNKKEGSVNEAEIISQVIENKPHFTQTQVRRALDFLREKRLL